MAKLSKCEKRGRARCNKAHRACASKKARRGKSKKACLARWYRKHPRRK